MLHTPSINFPNIYTKGILKLNNSIKFVFHSSHALHYIQAAFSCNTIPRIIERAHAVVEKKNNEKRP